MKFLKFPNPIYQSAAASLKLWPFPWGFCSQDEASKPLGFCRRRPCPRVDQKHVSFPTATNFMLSKWIITSESEATACFQATFVNLTNVNWLRLRNKIFFFSGSRSRLSGQVLDIQHFQQVASSAAICLWTSYSQEKKQNKMINISCNLQVYDPFSCTVVEYTKFIHLPQSMLNTLYSSIVFIRGCKKWQGEEIIIILKDWDCFCFAEKKLSSYSLCPNFLTDTFSLQTHFLSIFLQTKREVFKIFSYWLSWHLVSVRKRKNSIAILRKPLLKVFF